MSSETFYNRIGSDRISSRQIDELIGLARGLCADGILNQLEAEFLQSWLAANATICEQPIFADLYSRVSDMLSDDEVSSEERAELFETLTGLTGERIELGEVLKPSTLPLCRPQPDVVFDGRQFAFTGTFSFGTRRICESAVLARGASVGGVTMKTNYLVIGAYVTESWKHSSMGNKILKACECRDAGLPIAIISEGHWNQFL